MGWINNSYLDESTGPAYVYDEEAGSDDFPETCQQCGILKPCLCDLKPNDKHEKDCRCEDCESSRIDEVMAAEKERPDFEERLAEATTLTAARFDFRRREREAR